MPAQKGLGFRAVLHGSSSLLPAPSRQTSLQCSFIHFTQCTEHIELLNMEGIPLNLNPKPFLTCSGAVSGAAASECSARAATSAAAATLPASMLLPLSKRVSAKRFTYAVSKSARTAPEMEGFARKKLNSDDGGKPGLASDARLTLAACGQIAELGKPGWQSAQEEPVVSGWVVGRGSSAVSAGFRVCRHIHSVAQQAARLQLIKFTLKR